MIDVQRLRSIVEGDDSRASKGFHVFIGSLIVLSMVAFSIETLPSLSPETRRALRVFEVFTVAVFTVEYLLRLLVSRPSAKYVFSFFGLVDLAAIAPFYLATGLDLRAVRAVRLLRAVRLFKLARYSQAMRRFRTALASIREELVLFGAVTVLLLFLAATGIYYFERDAQPEAFGSIFHCLWWAVATLTTVGYGDVYPVTTGGKVFASVVVLVGLGVVAVPTGLLASALSAARRPDDSGPH